MDFLVCLLAKGVVYDILKNGREKDLLLVPYCKDRDMDIIQWPPFLLASKVYILVTCLLPISVLSISMSFCFSFLY